MDNIKEKICPLCHSENKCQAHSDEPCWCSKVNVPKNLLESLPDDSRSCICLSCIQAFKENNSK